jgi:hypothetical protein
MNDSPLAWAYLILVVGVLAGWAIVLFLLAMKGDDDDL